MAEKDAGACWQKKLSGVAPEDASTGSQERAEEALACVEEAEASVEEALPCVGEEASAEEELVHGACRRTVSQPAQKRPR